MNPTDKKLLQFIKENNKLLSHTPQNIKNSTAVNKKAKKFNLVSENNKSSSATPPSVSQALGVKSKSSHTNMSIGLATKNANQLYSRLDSMLVGKTQLDLQNKDLISVTQDFNLMLNKSRRISEKEKTKADVQITKPLVIAP